MSIWSMHRRNQIFLLVDRRNICSICLLTDHLYSRVQAGENTRRDNGESDSDAQGSDLGTSAGCALLPACVSLRLSVNRRFLHDEGRTVYRRDVRP